MAIQFNSADVNQTIVPETSFGVPQSASATRYELPVKSDTPPMNYKYQDIKSETRRVGRAGNGKRKGQGTADGTWEFRLSKAPVFKVLMANAVSGTWAGNVLKAADKDSTFTHYGVLSAGTGSAGTAVVEQTPGCICNGMTVSAKEGEGVTASFPITGAARNNLVDDNPLAVTPVGNANEYVGADVASVTINDLVLDYTEATLNVQHTKNPRGKLGTNAVTGYGVAGAREVTLTLQFYKDPAVETLVKSGATVSASFTIGGTGDGLTFSLPLADIDYPQVSANEGSLMSTVVITARRDDAQATDLVITVR